MTTTAKPFLTDIKELRRRAQEDIDKGAVTPGHEPSAQSNVGVLNQVLASEIVCVLRYQRHYYMAQGIHAEPVKTEFHEHWMSEQGHADVVAERIVQLNGEPDFNPAGLLTRAASEYKEAGESLVSMIKEDLVAERVVIMWYGELVRFFGESDPTTRRIMEQLLADEEEHAEDLASLLADFEHDGMISHEPGKAATKNGGSGARSGRALNSGDRSSDAL
jgi:bacterioferritin